MLLASPLQSHAIATPDRVALRAGEEQVSWSQLRNRVDTVRARFAGLSERVAHDLNPGIDWAVAFHALLESDATPVLFPPDLSEAERRDRMERAGINRCSSSLLSAGVSDTAPPAELTGPATSDWPDATPLFAVWTSGTTGTPELVEISIEQVIYSSIGAMSRLGLASTDCWLCALPTHHVGGASIFLRAAIFGFTVEVHETFDARRVNDAINAERVQAISVVPAMLRAILDDRDDEPFPPSLKAIMVGGSATPRTLIERAAAIHAPISLTWGMTETASHVATNTPGDISEGLAPIPFMRADARAGVLRVGGPAAPTSAFMSRDRGAVRDGRVHVFGRADNVILSGGENVDLDRIAAIYGAYDKIDEVAVVGLDSERWGARPHLAYLAAEALSVDELRAFGRERLQGFEIPDSFQHIASFPRNRTGKLDRSAVAELIRARITPS